MVSSLIAAPENGVGIVGIYPLADLRSWDAAQGQGTRLDSPEIVNGILAAARSGKGVINLSLGGPRDLAIELAVDEAVSLGSLIVAASGNEGDSGNQLGYPAALPHVLTVGATGRNGQVTAFSSSSSYVDIAAPGEDVTVASAIGNNWITSSGTSFSAPLVTRRRGVGLVCATRSDRRPGRRGAPALGTRPRHPGSRPLQRLRDAERRGGSRRAIRRSPTLASPTTTSTTSIPMPTATSPGPRL